MNWISNFVRPKIRALVQKTEVPENLWQKCDACGAEISLSIPVAFREIPRCPYCHDPVCFGDLEERRREAIEKLRDEHRPSPGREGLLASDFSPGLFLLLLFIFWPAALGYDWIKWRGTL